MIKHKELKTFEFKGIKVMVSMNYDLQTISLVKEGSTFAEKNTIVAKEYVFVKRELAFMPAWLNILDAMKFAITEANNEMTEYLAEKAKEAKTIEKAQMDRVTNILLEVTKDLTSNLEKNANKTTHKGPGRPKKSK